MGWSLKKATKSISKTAKSVSKSVGKAATKTIKTVNAPIKKATSGVGKVAKGDVKGGLGDITQAAANTGLDIVTGGNKKIVDAYSGGLLTSATSAARGNLKDGVRVGATGAAAVYGGPAAGFAVNSAFAGGGNVVNAGAAFLGSSNDLGVLSGFKDYLPAASNILTNSFGAKPKSQGYQSASMSVSDPNYSTQGGYEVSEGQMSKSINPIFIILGIAALGGAIFLLRRK